MSARQVLDPRWHILHQAIDRLYNELEPDQLVISVNIGTFSLSGQQQVLYCLYAADQWAEIDRRILTSDETVIDEATQVYEKMAISATPEEPPQ